MTVPLPPAATSKSNTSASEWLLTLLTSVLILPLFRPSSPVSKAMIVLGGSRRWRCFPSPPSLHGKILTRSSGIGFIRQTSWNKHDNWNLKWIELDPKAFIKRVKQARRRSSIKVDMELFLFMPLLVDGRHVFLTFLFCFKISNLNQLRLHMAFHMRWLPALLSWKDSSGLNSFWCCWSENSWPQGSSVQLLRELVFLISPLHTKTVWLCVSFCCCYFFFVKMLKKTEKSPPAYQFPSSSSLPPSISCASDASALPHIIIS